MKKLIGAVGLGVAAAAAVTVWLFVGSGGTHEYGSPQAAVLATCHAARAYTMPAPRPGDLTIATKMYRDYQQAVRRGRFPMYWDAPGQTRVRYADVERTSSGKYRVVTCAPKLTSKAYTRMVLGTSH